MKRSEVKYTIKQLSQPVAVFAMAVGFIGVLALVLGLYFFAQSRNSLLTSSPDQSQPNLGFDTDGNGQPDSWLPVVYQVAECDSTWKIAEQFYGDGTRYVEIEQANNLVHDQWLEVGMELTIPDVAKSSVINSTQGETTQQLIIYDTDSSEDSIDNPTQVSTAVEYQVQPGDTLWFIGLKYYGDGMAWTEIYQINQQEIGNNPNQISVGTTLSLPAKD
jgi:nucleoid-associated protein YgaU